MEIIHSDRNAIRIVTAGFVSYNKSYNLINLRNFKPRRIRYRRYLPEHETDHQESRQKL